MPADPFERLTRRQTLQASWNRCCRALLRPARPSRLKPGRAGPANLLLVGVDTLRADHLGLGGYSLPTSPNLDRLAAGGTVFTEVMAPAPWTLPSFASALTGLMPGLHGGYLAEPVRNMDTRPPRSLRPEVTTLAAHLQGLGYRTAAFYSNEFFAFGLAESFDHHQYLNLPAGELAAAALAWIRRHADGPFFCFVLMNDPHEPTTPPAKHLAPFLAAAKSAGADPSSAQLRRYPRWGEPPDLELGRAPHPPDGEARAALALKLAIYDATIHQVDTAIAGLYEQLRKWRIDDQTLVSVFADHGEEFLDHADFAHVWNHDPRPIRAIGHGHTQFQELLHVPWLAWGPGVPPGVRHDLPVSLLDLAPTLLDWLQLAPLPLPSGAAAALGGGLTGHSLAPAVRRQAAGCAEEPDRLLLAEAIAYGPDLVALRRGPWKLIARRQGQPLALFHLTEDPGETQDRQGDRPDIVAEFQQEIVTWLESGHGATDTGAGQWSDLDDTVRQRLKDLGYSE